VSSGACCTCTAAARRQAEPDEGEHTRSFEREIVPLVEGIERERDGEEHGESGCDAGRHRTRAAAGDAEPHLRALPVPAELAYLLHRRPRLRPDPPPELPQHRRRMVRA
jgi:hypothetical protein